METGCSKYATGRFVLVVLFYRILPESPRWLLLNHRNKEAQILLRRIADVNRRELFDSFDVTQVEVLLFTRYCFIHVIRLMMMMMMMMMMMIMMVIMMVMMVMILSCN